MGIIRSIGIKDVSHGGLKATESALQAALPDYGYVMKTDVKGYYESIDQTILLKQLDKDSTALLSGVLKKDLIFWVINLARKN